MTVPATYVGARRDVPRYTKECVRCGRTMAKHSSKFSAKIPICKDCRWADPEYVRMINRKDEP